jgi:glycine betaine catabolism B
MSGVRPRPFSGRFGFWNGQAVEATVISSRGMTPSTHDVVLRKPNGFDFLPVQFTFLTLKTDQGPNTRPMSLATSPTRQNLEYGVRISGSQYKRAFASLKPGDAVVVQGPFGDFLLDEERPAIFIAGGIGITPLKGMAEYAADKGLKIPIRLLYSNSTEDEIVYRNELDDLERRNPRFQVFHTLTGKTVSDSWAGSRGRIRPDLLAKASEGLIRPVYYLSGKPRMVSAVFDLLVQGGVQQEDIRVEAFRGYWN